MLIVALRDKGGYWLLFLVFSFGLLILLLIFFSVDFLVISVDSADFVLWVAFI